ncbi:2OG-Fe(II) oxygenase [Hydrogenophaga sp. NFH-34]|uniref:2OG-Fe(II) oxygenase n=1 Tax=Hydrogenophaga sp. NFH-34 TaxID=2744446 RepID=UPI001F19D516|nr:2OG-Fe(II) oxygenase [Hydrogenophaga sp. NFH-34]
MKDTLSQAITPELRQWIVEQASAGFPPDAVLQAMIAAGWREDVAGQALEATLREHLRTRTEGRPVPVVPSQPVQAGALSPAVEPGALPEVRLGGSPRQIDLGDRVVEVLATLQLPRVVVLGGLLSAEECEGLIEAAQPRMARSRTVQTRTGGEELNPDRTSDGMFFNRGESALLERIEARIARLVAWPVENGEGMQVLNYRVGAEYKAHYDYFDPAEPGTPTILRRGGQRVATLVMYLNEPVRGGGTTFPDVGLEVAPQRGNAVFFSYDRPHPATRTLHGGAPVLEGEKWVATKWLRERVFV